MMPQTNDLLDRINRIRWREQDAIVPQAEELIQRHLERIRTVMGYLKQAKGLPPAEAHGYALTPAPTGAEYKELLGRLFSEARLNGAGTREPVLATIAASQTWQLDAELASFPNPWLPLVDLYEQGYPTSYVDAPDGQSVWLRVGLAHGTKDYAVECPKAEAKKASA